MTRPPPKPAAGSPADPAPGLPSHLARIADAPQFHALIVGVILVAAITVGLETYPWIMARAGGVLHTIDTVVLTIFVVELIIRVGAHWPRPWRFFTNGWNVFDFAIVVACLLPVGGQYAAVLRLARVLRVLRLLTVVPRLRVLVAALLHSIPSIGYVAGLLLVLFYVYAVIGTFLFSANDPVHFGSLHRSMFSLLRTVTLEDWTDLYYTQSLGSDRYPPPGIERYPHTAPRAMPLAAAIYFASFVVIGTMIVLNLFIGVVLSSMNEAQAEHARAALDRQANRAGTLPQRLMAMERQLADLSEQVRALRSSLDQTPSDDRER